MWSLFGDGAGGALTSRTVHVNQVAANPFKGNNVSTQRYNLVTFIPKNLFEQFHRLANCYFMVIAMLQVFTDLSPTGKWTTIGPLMFIMTVSAVKDGVEDYARYKSDREVNNRILEVLGPGGTWIKKKWREVKVGDLVKVLNKEYFPADLNLLCSSEPLGMCYIETSQLDGETNLKIRQALSETNDDLCDTSVIPSILKEDRLCRLNAVIECELPNARINGFEGKVTLDGKAPLSLGPGQLLLRGAQLRQTAWVIGTVVFSGYDTKVVMNSAPTPTKVSNIEKRTNDFVLVILSLMMLLCTGSALANVAWADSKMEKSWYLADARASSSVFIETFFTYLILLSTQVPISLYVTLEIVKMLQAFHMNWDLDMYDSTTDTHAWARTSALNEELGQVEYIFSDKTGTLTQNLMQFRKCTVGGHSYGKGTTEIGRASAQRQGIKLDETADEVDDRLMKDPMFNFGDRAFLDRLNEASHPDSGLIHEYLTMLAVCHTVIPEGSVDDGTLAFQAASPDEAALVAAAKCFGFVFFRRTPEELVVRVLGKDVKFKLLNTLEFNSDRKRMSVVVQREDGKVLLYCKGADTMIMARLADNQVHVESTLEHLEGFANDGLRTLACAVREVPYEYWEEWNNRYMEASSSLTDRQLKLDEVAEEIEVGMNLLGTTAIEDKLQDGVADTISSLQEANIKIWVLTGDKQETAINIGFACKLLTDDMTLLVLNENSPEDTARALGARIKEYKGLSGDGQSMVAIIIDGQTLEHILADHSLKMDFLKLGKDCTAVVCCRVTPKQKADVTQMVKVHDDRICLSVGDGANDVAMIQMAHIGVGISGKEGLQAVQASDYSVAQFRFLKKLLLVHGHWNYRRVSRVITYTFYKNTCLYQTGFWFGLYNMASGGNLYESWTFSMFNMFFSSLPIIAYGCLDQDVSEEGLYTFPSLYRIGQKKKLFNARMFAYWMSNALVHSVICFLIPLFVFLSTVSPDGKDRGLYSMGMYIYTGVVYTVNFKILLMIRTHNYITTGMVFLMIFAWYLWLLIYQHVILLKSDMTIYMLGNAVLELPSWWLTSLLCPVVCLLRDFTWRAYKDCVTPNKVVLANLLKRDGKLREVGRRNSSEVAKRKPRLSVDQRKSQASLRRTMSSGLGYAYSHSDAPPPASTEGKEPKESPFAGRMKAVSCTSIN